MKTIRLFNVMAVTILTLAALTISSCSDDKKKTPDPTKPKVKLLPTKITDVSKDESSENTFTYNDKDQVTKIVSKEVEKGQTTIYNYTIKYADNGKIASLTTKKGTEPESTNKYTYDEKNTIVTSTPDKKEDTPTKIYINKDGYLRSTKEINPKNYNEYTYDRHHNLTKEFSYSIEEEEEKVIETEEETTTYTYSTAFSPYININLPAWIMDEIGAPLDPIYGGFFTASMSSTKKETRTEDGKVVKTTTTPSNITVVVSKEKENYPTEVKSEEKDGEKRKATITIEYKEVKKK